MTTGTQLQLINPLPCGISVSFSAFWNTNYRRSHEYMRCNEDLTALHSRSMYLQKVSLGRRQIHFDSLLHLRYMYAHESAACFSRLWPSSSLFHLTTQALHGPTAPERLLFFFDCAYALGGGTMYSSRIGDNSRFLPYLIESAVVFFWALMACDFYMTTLWQLYSALAVAVALHSSTYCGYSPLFVVFTI
jgi:hypothetical protein